MMNRVVKRRVISVMMTSLAGMFLLLAAAGAAHAGWEVEYSDWMIDALRSQGLSRPKRAGNFDTFRECEEARRQAIVQSGDPSLEIHSRCVGFDESSQRKPAGQPPPSAMSSPERADGFEPQRRGEENKNFDHRAKSELLRKLKRANPPGPGNGTQTGNTGKLEIKRFSEPPASAANASASIDVVQINRRIAVLQGYIAGLQTQLKGYSRTLHGNRTEFEKWEATVDKACNSVLDNSKEYILQMFLKYNLFGKLERNVQKSVFAKMGEYLDTSDPAVRRWLMEQMRSENIQLSRLKSIVEQGNLSGDLAALLSGGRDETKKNLDALLFVNSLLETGKIVEYDELLSKSKIFKEFPGEYFMQAKMIGETYADLSAIVYSWYSIKRLTRDVERYGTEVRSLGTRMRKTMKEIECLKKCLEAPSERCVERCAGKTRLHSPPPLPR